MIFRILFSLVALIAIAAQLGDADTIQGANLADYLITKIKSGSLDRLKSVIIRNSNFTLDPCEDFHEFVCNPKSESVDTFARREVELKSSSMIKDTRIHSNPTLTKLRAIFISCLRRGNRGHKPLLELLTKLGGFPLLAHITNWSENEYFDLTDWLIRLAKLGLDYEQFFNIEVTKAYNEDGIFSILLDAPKLDISNELEHYMSILEELDPDGGWSHDSSHEQLGELIDFIDSLIITKERRQVRLFTFYELENRFPTIEWRRLFSTIYDRNFSEQDQITILRLGHFMRLNRLLDSTSPTTLENFLFFGLIEQLGSKFATPLARRVASSPPSCLNYVMKELSFAYLSQYVKHHISEESRQTVKEMVELMKEELVDMIQRADWIEDRTKVKAEQKAKSIKSYIAIPDELVNENYVESLLEGYQYQDVDFLQNIMLVGKIKTKLNALRIDQTEWLKVMEGFYDNSSSIISVNAAYEASSNSLYIKAGQIDDLLFEPGRPGSLNFGTVGMAIGHELAHSFDPDCILYNYDGKYKCWWDDKTAKRYKKRTECIRSQYDQLPLPDALDSDVRVNGQRTLGENIADNVGYQIAYRSYLKWLDLSKGDQNRLPEIANFNNLQLFWISLSNVYCGHQSPESAIRDAKEDTHSPDKYRIVMPLRNSKQFSKDFGCPSGSGMNPMERCTIW